MYIFDFRFCRSEVLAWRNWFTAGPHKADITASAVAVVSSGASALLQIQSCQNAASVVVGFEAHFSVAGVCGLLLSQLLEAALSSHPGSPAPEAHSAAAPLLGDQWKNLCCLKSPLDSFKGPVN